MKKNNIVITLIIIIIISIVLFVVYNKKTKIKTSLTETESKIVVNSIKDNLYKDINNAKKGKYKDYLYCDKVNCKKIDNFNIKEDKLKINGIKLTSFTKLNENIICGPTPMLNPEMLIPIEETEVKCGDTLRLRLEYVMGGGVETIKTEILEIIHKD